MSSAASIALHAVIFPSLDAIKTQDPSSASILSQIRIALEKAEAANPGLAHDFVDFILESEQSKGHMDSVEKLLRISHQDFELYRLPEKTPELKILAAKAKNLKLILSSIPAQITDRTKFLGIIREIASSIKDLLDAVVECSLKNDALLSKEKLVMYIKFNTILYFS